MLLWNLKCFGTYIMCETENLVKANIELRTALCRFPWLHRKNDIGAKAIGTTPILELPRILFLSQCRHQLLRVAAGPILLVAACVATLTCTNDLFAVKGKCFHGRRSAAKSVCLTGKRVTAECQNFYGKENGRTCRCQSQEQGAWKERRQILKCTQETYSCSLHCQYAAVESHSTRSV